jgi:hypothetical protein
VSLIARIAVLGALLSLCAAAGASGASLEPVGEFEQPIFVTSSPEDPNRLLVVEREGRVVEVDGDTRATFGNLEGLVSCCEGERGLLSVAVAPDFDSTGRFYAAYTGTQAAGGSTGDLHVDAFRPSPEGGGGLLREPVITIGHSDYSNHNGGQLELGPDGYLYISTGDGGGGGDPLESGQDVESLLGKLLRIQPLPGEEPSYAIPPGNTFVGKPGRDEIWAYGLRNPWRFSFDRLSGDLVIADVGQDEREEVDLATSPASGVVGGGGANYGWNCREGFQAYPHAPESCDSLGGFTEPVFDYPHADPGGGAAHGCSIIGGYVVRDESLGDLYGRYIYADLCAGQVRSLLLPASGGTATDDRSEGLSVSTPTSFGEDSCGRLYVVSNEGTVYRLSGGGEPPCPLPPGGGATSPEPRHPGPARPARPRVRLREAARHHGRLVTLVVRISPCPLGAPGGPVMLNRGGRRLSRKRLDGSCVARFRLRVRRRATFRALLPVDDAGPVRSPRLLVTPGR